MAAQKPRQGPQDITPGTLSGIRPGQNVVPLSYEEDARLNELSQQQGISKTEAMRRLAESMPNIPQQPQKRSLVSDTLDKIQTARDMGIVDADPKDPVNQAMKLGLFKDLRKDMKKGDEDRMTTREIMEMNMVNFQMILLQKSMGGDNNTNSAASQQTQQMQQMLQKYDSTISDLKAENEKSRMFYEQRLKEQEDKFKEIVLEKRMQDIEEGQKQTLNTLSQQIADIDNQIKIYQNIPQIPTEDQKKDAIDHLEQLGGTLDRIKKALTPFGIIPQSGTGMGAGTGMTIAAPGSAISQYKNPDGSMNMTLYGIDKATEVAGRLFDAWSKKTPEPRQVQETQAQILTGGENGSGGGVAGIGREQPPQQQKQMTYQEFYVYLLNKGVLTQEEQQWKTSYEDYITKAQQERLSTKQQVPVQQPASPAPQRQQLDEALYVNTNAPSSGNVNQGPEQAPAQSDPEQQSSEPERKIGVVERLQQLEADNGKYTV
jgi:hypothetical protein